MNLLNNYSFVKKIGHGSYGEIWLVSRKPDHKKLVLKKIGLNKASEREKDAARLECQILKSLKHPNIVQYRDSFEENNSLYIAMSFCEGGDLYTILKERKGVLLSEKQIIEWLIQITMALSYIHEKNILHRDLKTQNIFLSRSVIKIGDLGIAKQLEKKHDMAKTIIGTPYYMSPELFEKKPYNFKSDIWSLGCVTYEMTTLRHAFQAKNFTALSYKILNGQTPDIPPMYSKDLVSLIQAMLHKNPAERPHTKKILSNFFIRKHVESFVNDNKRSESRKQHKRFSQNNIESDVHKENKEFSIVPARNSFISYIDIDKKISENKVNQCQEKKDISDSPSKDLKNHYDDNDDVIIARSSNESQSRSSSESLKEHKIHLEQSKTELEKELQKDYKSKETEIDISSLKATNDENIQKELEKDISPPDVVESSGNKRARQKRRERKRNQGLGTLMVGGDIGNNFEDPPEVDNNRHQRKYNPNGQQSNIFPLPELVRNLEDTNSESLNHDALEVIEKMNQTLSFHLNPKFANIKDSLLLYKDQIDANNEGPVEKEEETLERTKFQNKRYQEIRKEVMKVFGYEVLSKCFSILRNLSSNHETELKNLLGDDSYENYVGKIIWLKITEEGLQMN